MGVGRDQVLGQPTLGAPRVLEILLGSGISRLRQTRRGNFVITAGQTPLLEPISPDDEATGLINHALR